MMWDWPDNGGGWGGRKGGGKGWERWDVMWDGGLMWTKDSGERRAESKKLDLVFFEYKIELFGERWRF